MSSFLANSFIHWIIFHLLQDEVDSQNPVLRDNHQLQEEVKCWLKDQKVQEIFMQGEKVLAASCQLWRGPVLDFADVAVMASDIARSISLCLFGSNCCCACDLETLFSSAPQSIMWNQASASWHKWNDPLLLLPLGPYSLNGYRVRVYRQDSATQWFTGIITHHNLFSRNMVVMNDQVSPKKVLNLLPRYSNNCLTMACVCDGKRRN